MPPSRRTLLAVLAGTLLTSCRAPAGSGPAEGAPTPSAAPSPPRPPAAASTGTGTSSTTSAAGTPVSADPPPGGADRAVAGDLAGQAGRSALVARYGQAEPTSWGFDAPGVVSRLPDGGRAIALTFDACGGPQGSGYDGALIDFLRERRVPATLFLNSRWIDANLPAFRALAADPLFEIADHGTRHCPLSVTGRSAYDIPGTRDVGEVVDEITGNRAKLTGLLGHPPRFFRSGTAYLDDVAARIITDLGQRFAGFTVNGDGGATFSPAEVHSTVAAAPAGSIVLAHMNHPAGGTAAGIAAAVPELLAAGHHFVRLSEGAP
ncbi:polysaccharide deacetylase family protein [Kitasatospora sp. NPDC057015]|uniref:polysaccharide deacetylase family protein n=1 Tax=Kitasatospora sp. NPDC057015 TaxID=3346001 RepID=UPI003637980B